MLLSNLTLPVGNSSPIPLAETVTAENSTATANVDFDFTSISTTTLIPATSTSVGSLTLDFLGTFASDSTSQYTLGQPAEMTITCSQPATGQSITCGGAVGTPVSSIFEPGSLALLGSALFGLSLDAEGDEGASALPAPLLAFQLQEAPGILATVGHGAGPLIALVACVTLCRRPLHPTEHTIHRINSCGFLPSGQGHLIMETARHKSVDVLAAYVRRVDMFKDHAGSAFL